jgi:hypothetical protein
MGRLLLPLVGLATIPIGVIWSGYVLSVLWRWFVVPWFGLAPLSVVQAIGLALVIGFLTHQHIKNDYEDSTTELIYQIAMAIFRPAFALFFGWIVKSFI